MRLAAQAKMGYYPVPPETLAYVCQHIKVPDPAKTFIIDPCCGAGLALRDIGQHLQLPPENLYGVELDDRRAASAAEVVGNVVHCSFFNARIVPVQSFSMAWVNPPYENEIRQEDENSATKLEHQFLTYIARYVTTGGLIILHMPENRVDDSICQLFHSICNDAHRIILPQEMRLFGETLLVGVKRKQMERNIWDTRITPTREFPAVSLPPGESIRAFVKVAPTDAEIEQGLAKARFWKSIFENSKTRPKLKPVLPMGPGHLGLTLASGYLDGLLKPAGSEPHVTRGIAYKEDELAKTEESEDDEGAVTTTKTFRQNMKLKLRAITANGIIHEIR